MFAPLLHAYSRELMNPGVRVGPFLASFDDHDAGVYRNYAVPDDGAEPTTAEVAALVAAFVDRGRTPRLEYLPELAPALEDRLLAAGFVPELRLPVMTCAPDDVPELPVPPGISLGPARSDAELWSVVEAQAEAYGQPDPGPPDLDRLRGTVERGGLVALARDAATGLGVGGGLCAPPHGGVSELAAVGVRAAYRRRGIAAALTALLTRTCPEVGITTPFLTPAGPAEERVYRTAGYVEVTSMLHISR